MTVVHGVVLRERTLRQPVQVLGSQESAQVVWVSGPMIVVGYNYHYKELHDGMRDFQHLRLR